MLRDMALWTPSGPSCQPAGKKTLGAPAAHADHRERCPKEKDGRKNSKVTKTVPKITSTHSAFDGQEQKAVYPQTQPGLPLGAGSTLPWSLAPPSGCLFQHYLRCTERRP